MLTAANDVSPAARPKLSTQSLINIGHYLGLFLAALSAIFWIVYGLSTLR